MGRGDKNKPRCPVCHAPLALWVSGADVIRAACDDCGWGWIGG